MSEVVDIFQTTMVTVFVSREIVLTLCCTRSQTDWTASDGNSKKENACSLAVLVDGQGEWLKYLD